MKHLAYNLCLAGDSVTSGILGIAAVTLDTSTGEQKEYWWAIDLSDCEKYNMQFSAGSFYAFAGFSAEVIKLVKARAGKLATALQEFAGIAEGVQHMWADTSFLASVSDHAILQNAYHTIGKESHFPVKNMHNVSTLYALGVAERVPPKSVHDPRDNAKSIMAAVVQAFRITDKFMAAAQSASIAPQVQLPPLASLPPL